MLLFILVFDAIVFYMLFGIATGAVRKKLGIEELYKNYKEQHTEGIIHRQFLGLVVIIGILPSTVMYLVFRGTIVFNLVLLVFLYVFEDYKNTLKIPKLNLYYKYMMFFWGGLTIFSFIMDLR